MVYAIEAGGFSSVAKSFDTARSTPVPPKFYLDKYEDTAITKNEPRKLRNKALSELQKLFDKNTNKMFYVAKVVDPNSVQYKKSTPNDVIYDNLDKFINGEGSQTNAKRAAQEFITTCDLDMETLKIRALIKDSTYFKYIMLKSDGMLYHSQSNTMLGRNSSELIEFFKNPLNDKILDMLMEKVEKDWIK